MPQAEPVDVEQTESREDLRQRIGKLEDDLLMANQRCAQLQELLNKLLRTRFGRRTERSDVDDPGQTWLDFLPDAIRGQQADLASQENDPDSADTTSNDGKRAKGSCRRKPSAKYPQLPVIEEKIELPEDERFDADGTPLVASGTEESEEIVVEPARAYIKRVIRVRYARSDTAEKIITAPRPQRIYPRSMLACISILQIVVMHAADCLPFHRQAEIFARMGLNLGRQVLIDAFRAWCRLAAPLLAFIEAELLQSPVLHIDGTFLKWQDGKRRRRCTRTVMYGISDGSQLLLRWRKDETHAAAADLLPGFTGVLIRDEWAGWAKMDGAAFTPGGCNSHARRPFALLQDDDGDAAAMVALYAELYRVEHRILESGLTGKALLTHRGEQRQQHSVAIMDRIEAFAADLADRRTGSMATASRYIITHRDNLRRFLDDPRLPLDNNLAENVLRRIALLRKNRLFIVSEEGGVNLATAMSITGSCRLLCINPVDYMTDVLPALFRYREAVKQGLDPPDLTDWTPAAYAARMHADKDSGTG